MKETIELAKDAGYKSSIAENEEYIHLCLIQKFLRDEKEINVEVNLYHDVDNLFWQPTIHKIELNYTYLSSQQSFSKYNHALEAGLIRALLILTHA